MEKKRVAYIHMHTVNSEKDAIASSKDYALKITQMNQESKKYEIVGAAITEHSHAHSMCSARLDFEAKGINHILGSEAYLCSKEEMQNKDTRYHFVLMPANGYYKEFVHLMTEAGHTKKKTSYKTYFTTTHEMLEKYGYGMIGTTACIGGRVAKYILNDDISSAKKYIRYLQKHLYKLYLEVQPHETKKQIKVNKTLVKLSEEMDIPLIVGVDAHYVEKEEHEVFEAFKAMTIFMDSDKECDEEDRETYYSHMRSFEEIEEFCIKYDIPLDAIYNTYEIYNDTKEIDFRPKNIMDNMPNFPVPDGYTTHDYLVKIAHESLYNKIEEHGFTDVKNRLKRLNEELRVIDNSGFSGYFLVLWDWVKAMRERNIMIGPGRGCFIGRSKVMLSDFSYKYIKDIKIGDKVINAKGQEDTVIDTLAYSINEDLVNIKSSINDEKIICTKDHKILCNNGEYKEAKDITLKDKLCIPKYNLENDEACIYEYCGLKLDKDLGELVGIILSCCDSKFNVSFYDDRVKVGQRLIKLFKDCLDKDIRITKLIQAGTPKRKVYLNNNIIYTIKRILYIIKTENVNSSFEKGLIKGFFFSSFYYSKKASATTYSDQLLDYMFKISFKHGIFTTRMKLHTKTCLYVSTCCYDKLYSLYDLSYESKSTRGNWKVTENDKYFLVKIKDIDIKRYSTTVYDLTVENNHSYNINSIAVHNSAAGSLVNYVLGITNIDPIAHGLLFSRFLNEERLEMPDDGVIY